MTTGRGMYDGKVFAAVRNSASGEVSEKTHFRYHQDGDVVWAEYAGGEIFKGFLLGKVIVPDGGFTFYYQHVNTALKLRHGECVTTPEWLSDGRLRLHETWRWLDGEELNGTSMLEEIK